MRKTALLLSVLVTLHAAAFAGIAGAAELPLRIVVDDKRINPPDAQPFIDAQKRTQVPVRFVAEALGAEVDWDAKLQTAAFTRSDVRVALTIGRADYAVNGNTLRMDTAALLKDGRTFVPARYVAEALGATVYWEESIATVYISSSGEERPPAEQEDVRTVAGFEVPADSKLGVVEVTGSLNFEAHLIVDFLKDNFPKQIEDMETVLLQRFSEDTVSQVMNHIRKKTTESYVLEELTVYDKGTDHYLVVTRASGDSISLWVYKKGWEPKA
ncbi:copper amine oxidase N-terminal domain-containing protein [Paenibacillus sp. TRM 82003]|nr:copper amine oxidase N-terminal domain-containing protein [Paenibacillus sp. TRM 82003]